MDLATVKAITIPEGNVVKITSGSNVLWEVVTTTAENLWNLLERTEFRGERADATYYFNHANANHRMYLSEEVYVNGGNHAGDGSYYSNSVSTNAKNFCTLSNITENGFTITTGNSAEGFVAFPFHLNAGETIKVTHTRSGHNRSGYQIFNPDGTRKDYVRENLSNSPGAVHSTEYTATTECWFFWLCGRMDANTSVTVSNIQVTIT
jgi:hypothetical protein